MCTIPPTIPLTTFLYYHRHERFHYIKLNNDATSTLISCTGIKSFDRIIELRSNNIENNTLDALKKKINNPGDLPFELLVCSPATYAHYKSRKKHLHHDLDTVYNVKPLQEPNYELVEDDGSIACVTLMNSMYTAGGTLDGSQFKTADPSFFPTPGNNKPLPANRMNQKSKQNPQVRTKRYE